MAHYKMHSEYMPLTDEVLNKMFHDCKMAWLESQQGAPYKQKHDQLMHQLNTLYTEIDENVSEYMKEKYIAE